MNSEQKELLEFSSRWDAAMSNNNADEISQFMSDDWKITGSNGITTKKVFLDWIRSGLVTHSRMDSDESIINIYGETGILISRGTSAGTYKGENFSHYEWSQNVFIRHQGQWTCVSTMITAATEPDKV